MQALNISSRLALLIGSLLVLMSFTPAVAESIPPNVLNGIYGPTAPERFFNQGQQEFKLEIDRLQNPPSPLVLKIDPTIKQQQEIWQEQQLRQWEEWLHNRKRENCPANRTDETR